MNYFDRAKELENEVIQNRRTLHNIAEIGFELEKTLEFISKQLESYGISYEKVGKAGIVATIGFGDYFLLRADMDALPMEEKTDVPFKATNGNCHSCGHDAHTAMLLLASKMLKENEENLKHGVKLMFQPAEELLSGAKDMIENGVLTDVKSAFALHVEFGSVHSHTGHITYSKGPAMFSGDSITVKVTGLDCHGSTPQHGIDAINIASHIVLGLNEIISREVSSDENCVLIVGKITGGTTCNTLAGYAELECSVRATSEKTRKFLIKRIEEVSSAIATAYRGSAETIWNYGCGPLVTNVKLTEQLVDICKDITKSSICIKPICGTEDFSLIAEKVPSAYFFLGAGSNQEGYNFGMHNPNLDFNEEVLVYGASMLAKSATEILF